MTSTTVRDIARRSAILGARLWAAASRPFQATRLASITDNGWWSDHCARAAADERRFARFRRGAVHRVIVESTPVSEARRHLAAALARTPHYAGYFDRFRSGDTIGSPRKAEFAPHGCFAPSTLRYIRYLSECEARFGAFDGARIVEIGIGFGGLAKIFFDRFDVERYVLVDLPGPLALARRFLETALGGEIVRRRIEFRDGGGSHSGDFDLAISTLAFSECERSVQRSYLANILARAKFGYIHWNDISRHFGVESMRLPELAAALPGEVAVEHDDSTYWYANSHIVTWRPPGRGRAAHAEAGAVA